MKPIYKRPKMAGIICLTALLSAGVQYATAVELENLTVPAGKRLDITDISISTWDSVTVESNGEANFRANNIRLQKGFKAKSGSRFTARPEMVGGNPPLISSIYDFDAFEVTDARLEAKCQNFADSGAFYHFKIIGGRVFYVREGEFKGEYSYDAKLQKPFYKSYSTLNAGTTAPAPYIEMIALDDNVVFAYARKSDGSPLFLWGQMVHLYPGDFIAAPSRDLISVNSYYTKVNPQDAKPTFPSLPNHHFSTIGYQNDEPIAIPGTTEYFSKNMPDLKDAVLDPKLDLVSDAMVVKVDPKTWYEVGDTPPRNGVFGTINEMASGGYEAAKKQLFKRVWRNLDSLLLEFLDTENSLKLKNALKSTINSGVNAGVSSEFGNLGLVDGAVVGAVDFFNWVFGKPSTEEQVKQAMKAFLCGKLDAFSIPDFIHNTTMFYDSVTAAAISGPFDKARFKKFENALIDFVYNEIDDDGDYQRLLSNGLVRWALGLGNLSAEAQGSGSAIVMESISELSETNLSLVGDNENDPNCCAYWIKQYWNGFYNWNRYFRYPSDMFEMEETRPYVNTADRNKVKTHVKIKEILDVGVGNPHRYEHYRKHNGGECQDFFGEFKGKMEDVRTRVFRGGIMHGEIVEGNGYNDGTTNYFILAKIGMKPKGSAAGAPYQDAYAVMWMDEQEYFSERWRVVHPRDNAFEGPAGTFLSMFPVMCWNDGANMDDFENKYGTPYLQLTSNARMATSRYAMIIADESRIYTNCFFWATTDSTWRWRNYPGLGPNDFIDKKSVRIRDDMTICFKGKKTVNGTLYDGYWYQRLLNYDNKYVSRPTTGGMPVAGENFIWNFMEKTAFEAFDKTYWRMGVNDGPGIPGNGRNTVCAYKGYTPRSHKFLLKQENTYGWSTVKVCDIQIFDVCIRSHNKNVWGLLSAKPMSDAANRTAFYQKFGNRSLRLDVDSAGIRIPFQHPMYAKLKGGFQPLVTMRVVHGLNDFPVAFFEDSRYDDLGIFNPIPPQGGALSKEISYKRYFLVDINNPANVYTLGVADGDHSDFEDLNQWSDPFAGAIQIRRNGTKAEISNYNVSDYNGDFSLCFFRVGTYENGEFRIVLQNDTKGLPVFSRADGASLTATQWDALLNKYLSPEGKVKYGTTVWAASESGESNSFISVNLAPSVN